MSLSGAFAQCEKDKDCPEDMPGCKDGTCVRPMHLQQTPLHGAGKGNGYPTVLALKKKVLL